MIATFPTIYDDELVYSVLSRFYDHSGILSFRYAAESLFLNKLSRPTIEFVNAYTDDALAHLLRKCSMEFWHNLFLEGQGIQIQRCESEVYVPQFAVGQIERQQQRRGVLYGGVGCYGSEVDADIHITQSQSVQRVLPFGNQQLGAGGLQMADDSINADGGYQ